MGVQVQVAVIHQIKRHTRHRLSREKPHCNRGWNDVQVALQANLNVAIVDGSEENIKITHPEDFERVGRILKDL